VCLGQPFSRFNWKSGQRAPKRFSQGSGSDEYVGRFVVSTKYEDIPGDVIELGKKSILDGLGLALAGSRAQTGTICRDYLEHLGVCDGKASIIGSSKKTSPRFAAFVNGVSIHADDSTTRNSPQLKIAYMACWYIQPCPLLPAVLALAEGRTISGKEFMLAYHLGAEVECKIAEAISPRHYQDGFHSTGNLRLIRLGSSLREIISIRSFEDTQYLRASRQPVGRLARKFRHDD